LRHRNRLIGFISQSHLFLNTGANSMTHNVEYLRRTGIEKRPPVTAAKFITKSSLFILLLGVIRRLELKPNSEQKAENIFVAPPYSQTACSSNTCGGLPINTTGSSTQIASFLLFIKCKQK